MKIAIVAGLGMLVGLAGQNAMAVTVVVSNVVCSYQTDAQRQAYVGRAGEIVRNTEVESRAATVFDGSTTGGFPVVTIPSNVYEIYAGDDADENGSTLQMVMEAINDRYSVVTNGPIPEIRLSDGVYALPGSVSVANSLRISALDKIPSIDHSLGGNGIATNRWKVSIIQALGISIIIFPYGGDSSTELILDSVRITGGLTLQNGAMLYATDCLFDKGSGASISLSGDATFDRSVVDNALVNSSTTPSSIRYSQCYFGPNHSDSTVKFATNYYSSVWVNSSTKLASGANTRSGFNAVMEGVRMSGTTPTYFFYGPNNSATDGTNVVHASDCDFGNAYSATSGWVLGIGSVFKDCTGIKSAATNATGVTFIGCTDENGAIIPNKVNP